MTSAEVTYFSRESRFSLTIGLVAKVLSICFSFSLGSFSKIAFLKVLAPKLTWSIMLLAQTVLGKRSFTNNSTSLFNFDKLIIDIIDTIINNNVTIVKPIDNLTPIFIMHSYRNL